MARRASSRRLQAIYQTIQNHPGERPGFIARLLGLHRSQVTRILPSLEDQGYYLSEDEQGGLWPFQRKK